MGYAPGIDFVLKSDADGDGTCAAQMHRLMDLGVAFKVCNSTLRERNATPDVVLANFRVVPTGLNEIVRLQAQEGYNYFRH